MWLYPVMFAITLLQGWVLTLGALALGHSLRILDFPDRDRKRHDRVTPRTGGVAVCLALLLGVLEWMWCLGPAGMPQMPQLGNTPWIMVSTGLLCLVGLVDDKYGMRAGVKFLLQVVAVLPFVLGGQTATNAHLFGFQFDLTWLSIPICLLWLVACANFVNLVDGLDGLAGSVGLIVSLAVAGLAWWNGSPETTLLALLLSGALVGFLCFNWPPATIFLGDSGSLPIGFLVGALALEASAKKAAGLTIGIPIVLLCVPIFDTVMAIVRRKLNGRGISQGDREHIHHVLRDRGLSPAQTLLSICLMCAVTAAAGLAATVFNNDWIALAICAALLVTLVGGRVFGYNEARLLIRHVQAFGAFVKWMPENLRAKFAVTRLEHASIRHEIDLWDQIVARAESLSAATIEFVCEDVNARQELATLSWTARSPIALTAPASAPAWELSYAVPRGTVRTRILAKGSASRPSGSVRLNQLSELLVALCESWPIDPSPLACEQTAA